MLIPIVNDFEEIRQCDQIVNLLNKGQRLCVCLFSIEIQTAGWIRMKFGMEVVLKGKTVLGEVSTQYPPPRYRVHKGGPGCLWSLSHSFW